MGKTSATIKLIQVLSSRSDYVKTGDLAELIGTNPRNIKEYIKEIEECGYVIDSQNGLYGGYKLKNSTLMPTLNLSKVEKNEISSLLSYLKDNDYEKYDEISNILGKITANNEIESPTPLDMIDRFPLSMSKSELQKRYTILADGIENQLKVIIKYRSIKDIEKEHTIHPYKLFSYNGSFFILAFNETIDDFCYFKLNRIESILPTRYHFTLVKSFDVNDYLDEYGMKKNGDYYHVVLEFKDVNVAIKERVYGKNQKITDLGDNKIRFECDMQNKDMILSFVLSFGSHAKIIEPEWLKDNITNTITEMIDNYE